MNRFIDELRERYCRLYIKGDYEDKIKLQKDRIVKTLVIIGALFILMIAVYGAGRIDERNSLGIEDGRVVSIDRPEAGTSELELGLGIAEKDGINKKKVVLDIDASKDGEEETEAAAEIESSSRSIDDLVRDVQDQVENDPARKTIILPSSLSDGTAIVWYETSDFRWGILILLTALGIYYVYRSRFDIIIKEEKKAYDDIAIELPGFINKCVLLLNGGLVLTDVIERIVAEYEKSTKDSYLYSQLSAIMENHNEYNTPFDEQLAELAGNTGSRELSRIAGIIKDNLSKGTSLVEKLEAESSYLWFMRKKKAEELGRLADTKLTFPLMILLVVLITVTVAPAMLEM